MHVLAHTCMHVPSRPQVCGAGTGTSFSCFQLPLLDKPIFSLSITHSHLWSACYVQDLRGWAERSRRQLAPEGQEWQRSCPWSCSPPCTGPKARCHCLHFLSADPEVQRSERGTDGNRGTRLEALCSIPRLGSWMVQGFWFARNPSFQGKPRLGGATQNLPNHSASPPHSQPVESTLFWAIFP